MVAIVFVKRRHFKVHVSSISTVHDTYVIDSVLALRLTTLSLPTLLLFHRSTNSLFFCSFLRIMFSLHSSVVHTIPTQMLSNGYHHLVNGLLQLHRHEHSGIVCLSRYRIPSFVGQVVFECIGKNQTEIVNNVTKLVVLALLKSLVAVVPSNRSRNEGSVVRWKGRLYKEVHVFVVRLVTKRLQKLFAVCLLPSVAIAFKGFVDVFIEDNSLHFFPALRFVGLC
mmetsp:Transcript_13298/g.19572  ORF Transcript_13298/g.19572 Transcript_13298/m.19572 type:complete len:224 (-) Transcript_13298:641-1312(-)